MKSFIKIILVLFITCISSYKSFASHILAAYFTHILVSQTATTATYEVTLHVWGDECEVSNSLNDSYILVLRNNSNNSEIENSVNRDINQIVGNTSPGCECDRARYRTYPHTYVLLKSMNYEIGTKGGVDANSGGLSARTSCGNFSNPVTTVYVYDKIFHQVGNVPIVNQNSPVFDLTPHFLAVSTIPQNFAVSGTDADGDVLTYEIVNVQSDYLSPLNYVAPFSNTNPIPGLFNWIPTATTPNATGILGINPIVGGYFALGILIKQFRNINGTPTLVGETTREMILEIAPWLNNTPPILNPFQENNTYSIQANANYTSVFHISANDPNGDNISTQAQLSSSILSYNPGWMTITVTPSSADVGTTHSVVVTAVDDNCDHLSNVQIYNITICPPPNVVGNIIIK